MSDKKICTVPACGRAYLANGYCRMHYRRARAGKPLTGPSRGDQSGYGFFGVLEELPGQTKCHECGQWFENLGAHVARSHGLSAREYKIRHGLPVSKSLLSQERRDQLRAATRQRTASIEALKANRDPLKASQARTEETWLLVSAAKRQDPTSNEAAAEATRLREVTTCLACGVQWCWLPGAPRKRVTCSQECSRTLSAHGAAMMPRQNTTQRDKKFLRLYEKGHTLSEIARQHDLSHTAVRHAIHRAALIETLDQHTQ